MKGILFLGTSLLGAQYMSEAVSAFGYRPIFLLNIDDYSGDPRRAIEQCEYYKADVNSLDDIYRAIEENKFIDDVVAVTSLLDETLQYACAVAKRFGIVGPDAALARLTDKATVRSMIPEFSPPSLIFTWSDFSANKVIEFFDEYRNFSEFVLKPGISSGAVGISILTSTTTEDQIRKFICDSGIENPKQQSWIIQPRLHGRLHSLEGYVTGGKISYLGFSRRIRKELTESVTEFPVDKALPEKLQLRCKEAVQSLVQRSGYLNGYFHCEFIINSESAYFIDGNMGRIAGAAIVQQLALIYGKKPAEIYEHVFDLGLFKGVHTQNFQYKRVSEEMTISINYCLPEPATVSSVIVPGQITSFHTRIVDNNRAMPGVGKSDSAWIGFFAGFKKSALEEISQLTVQTNKGCFPPFYTLTEKQDVALAESH